MNDQSKKSIFKKIAEAGEAYLDMQIQKANREDY